VAASKASKRSKEKGHVPPPEQVHAQCARSTAVLLAAEDQLEQDGKHMFQRKPNELFRQWARVHQAVLSEGFWFAAQACNS
jgi:hypothetical protein